MNTDKPDPNKNESDNHNVVTPEPPQVMNPSEHPKKNSGDDKHSKNKKKEKKKVS